MSTTTDPTTGASAGALTLLHATTSREALQRGLALISPARSKVCPMVCVSADTSGLTLAADNGALAIRHRIPAEGETTIARAGAVCVNAKQLRDLAGELAPGAVSLTMLAGDRMRLDSGRHTARFSGAPASAFVTMADATDRSFGVAAGVLQSHISKVAYAVGTDEQRPLLTGVFVEVRPSRVSFTATNGFRVSTLTVKAKVAEGRKLDLVIPPVGLEAIAASFDADEAVTCAVRSSASGPSHLTVRSATTTVTVSLIAGDYPDYRRVLPAGYTTFAQFDRFALLSALRRVMVMAGDTTHRVRIQFDAEGARIDAETPDRGDCDDLVPGEFVGERLEIGFNAAYLIDALRRIPTPSVQLSLKAPDLGVGVLPVDLPAGDIVSFQQVVMPLRLTPA